MKHQAKRLWRPVLGGAALGLWAGIVVGNANSQPVTTYTTGTFFPLALVALLIVVLTAAAILTRSKEFAVSVLAVFGACVLGVNVAS